MVKFFWTSVTPANAGWPGSMPVSSTATTTPLPVKGEVEAPTALTPQVGAPAAGCACPSAANGSISFIGIGGAMQTTSASLASALISRLLISSISIVTSAGGVSRLPKTVAPPRKTSRVAARGLRRIMCFSFMVF